MARRTKLESEQTRRRILDAARETFLRRGMTGTTLEHVASAAGVTRGAIYWHFTNKKALFDAMRSRVCLPTIDRTDVTTLATSAGADQNPLRSIERFLIDLLAQVTSCTETQQTFEIMAFKCEYVAEFEKELDEHRRKSVEIRDVLAGVYRRAQRAGSLRDDVKPKIAAAATLVFMMGLIRLWLLDRESSIVRRNVRALIAAHVNGMRKRGAQA